MLGLTKEDLLVFGLVLVVAVVVVAGVFDVVSSLLMARNSSGEELEVVCPIF